MDEFIAPMFSSSYPMSSHNPFSVFVLEAQPRLSHQIPLKPEEPEESSISILPMMTTFPDGPTGEKFLFHHYVNHVAIIMMPYEHPRNPWRSHYPAVALELASVRQGFLYNAIIAHAAFNVGRLRGNDGDFLRLGMNHYGNAINGLSHAIGREDLDFPATIASIISLMFAEVWEKGGWVPWQDNIFC